MKSSTKNKMYKLFWGAMADVIPPKRTASLVFTAVAIAAFSFCQLSVFPIGNIGGSSVYVVLAIAPLMLGAIMFGPLMATLFGLLSGVVLFVHANVFALDFFEFYYFTNPFNTFVLFTVLGIVGGCAFSFIVKRKFPPALNVVLICLGCLVVSCILSMTLVAVVLVQFGAEYTLEEMIDFLLISPTGMVIQILVDALAASALSLVGDKATKKVIHEGNRQKLSDVFRNWMIMVSAIVFMTVCSAIFSFATLANRSDAQERMYNEVSYLASQLSISEDEGTLSVDPGRLLSGYQVSLDGDIVVTNKAGTIVATDNSDRWPVGGSYAELTGYLNESLAEGPEAAGLSNRCIVLERIADTNGMEELQVIDANGKTTMDPLFTVAVAYDAGYVAMMWNQNMVYASRFGTMLAATILAALLIVSIAVLANTLLRRMVIRHIDDTNSSLEKITYGDLDERVGEQDTLEFYSLSTGINTTVVALKETIEEVEQRNAQDLATAKAIQEDALPTEFPAFPEIDKFDIYASMKTAKEVGGDFYDFFEIPNTTKVAFVMADVSGKGIPAALFMMAAKTQLRNHMEAGLAVDEAVNAVNHQLCLGNDAGMFVTSLVCALDYETGRVEYVNAGHNPPLVLHDGVWDWKTKVSGMPLGLFDGISYDKLEFDMAKEDTIYLYTDGVTEAMSAEDELFGEERLEQTLGKYAGMNPRSICVGVRRAITDFTHDAEQSDDITMLALKYGVPPEEKAVMVLDADRSQLVHAVNYIHAELHRRKAPKSVYSQLDLACEELFTNVCLYAYPDATPENPGKVRIQFEYEPTPPTLTVQIADDGVPYNPLAKEDAATADSYDDIMDVPIGGLGILLAKKNTDEMYYERVDGRSNVLTFKKSW